MKKLLLLFNLLLIFQGVQAHQIGHGNAANSHQRKWHFENHSIAAKGSFLSVKDDSVFIESGQKVISFAIDELSWTDRDFIKRKEKQIATLNASAENEAGKGSVSPFILGGIILLAGILVLLLLRASRKKPSQKISTAVTSICILVSAVACGSHDGVAGFAENLVSQEE